jgi:glycosyltransferase involved in cell wall biosynthesis
MSSPRPSCRSRQREPWRRRSFSLTNDAPLLLDVTRLVWRRWAGRQPTGIDRVCLAYLDHFGPRAQAVVHHPRFRRILDRASSGRLFDLLRGPPERFRGALVTGALRRLGGHACDSKGRLYLNIGHTGLDQDGFGAWVRQSDARPVYFVHDLIPLTNPEFCRPGEAERHRKRMRTALATASGVIANSHSTIDELTRFAGAEALPCPPALAAWLGTRDFQRNSDAHSPAARPTFLVLGTIEARKNHLLLLRIWQRLAERMKSAIPQLVIIGQRGWEADEVFNILDGKQAISDHVIELNACADDELARHFAGARALLFPSKVEGYGLPLVEALAAGLPVIASDLPVFHEIGQGVPMLLDPEDEGAWERAILDFAQPKSAARADQLRRLAGFRAPTWSDHFEAVEAWLAKMPSALALQ